MIRSGAALTSLLPPALTAALALLAVPVAAQDFAGPVGLSGVHADLERIRQVAGVAPPRSILLRRHFETVNPAAEGDHPIFPGARAALHLLPVDVTSARNSGWADDRDNGHQWAGRGWSGLVRFGVGARWRWFSAALAPEVTSWQNEEFETRTRAGVPGTASHAFYGLDMPQRMGDEANSELTLGQSFIRADAGPIGAGFSAENLWSGPATRYPIILGNSAAGFPHAFLGTNREVDLWIARLDARAIVGWTRESDFRDANPANDFSNLVVWGLGIRPRGVEWLEVGVQRALHYQVDEQYDVDPDQVLGFLRPSDTNREGDELASAHFRALLPGSGIEFYGEWARTDRFIGWLTDFFPEPDHSQGYLFGLRKLARLSGGRTLSITAELVDLQEQQELRAGAGRPLPTFYTNTEQGRGHTHRGQILGASIGPGADAQFLGFDYVDADDDLIGIFYERIRRNDGTSQRRGLAYDERDAFPFRHDVELIGGVRVLQAFGDVNLGGTLSWGRRYNRVFLESVADNVQLTVQASWRP